MTPPEALRLAADMLERARRDRDRELLAETRAVVAGVLAGIDTALDPIESAGRAMRQAGAPTR